MSNFFHKFSSFLGLTLLVALPVRAAEIGVVAEVISYAYGTPPESGEKSALYTRDGILANHHVETVTGGGLHIKFVDDTDLRLGSESSLVIDKYVYDPNSPNQAGVFQLSSGVLRIITGKMKSEAYELNTPVAIIGIRGSDVEVSTTETDTKVTVYKGGAKVTNRSDGSSVDVPAGKTAVTGIGKPASLGGIAPAHPLDKSLRSKNQRGGSSDRGGHGGGGGCFAEGTQVLMADGSARNIEEVRIGDLVMGGNGSVNRVTGIETPALGGGKLYGFNGGRPFVTAAHPLLTADGWKSIDPQATFAENPTVARMLTGNLTVGDRLISDVDKGGIRLVSLTAPEGLTVREAAAVSGPADALVYNLLIDGDQTYRVRAGADSPEWQVANQK